MKRLKILATFSAILVSFNVTALCSPGDGLGDMDKDGDCPPWEAMRSSVGDVLSDNPGKPVVIVFIGSRWDPGSYLYLLNGFKSQKVGNVLNKRDIQLYVCDVSINPELMPELRLFKPPNKAGPIFFVLFGADHELLFVSDHDIYTTADTDGRIIPDDERLAQEVESKF